MKNRRTKQIETRAWELLEMAPDALVVVDREGWIVLANAQAEKLFGYTKDELLDSNADILIPERLREKVRRHREFFFGSNRLRSARLELWGSSKDGKEFPTEVTLNQLHTEEGLLVSAAIRDITEKKKTEEALRQSKYFLDNIIENIPNMIFIKEAGELRFVLFNKAGEDLIGLTREEMIGKNDYDFFPKEQADFFTSKDREVLESGNLLDIPEEPIDTKSLGKRFLHTKKVPLYDRFYHPKYVLGIAEDITEKVEKGEYPAYLLGVSEDITEKKAAEEAFQKMTRELERSNAELEQFAYIASHDLREPLRTVNAFLQLLWKKYEPKLDAEAKEYIDFAVDAAERMNKLIQGLLQYSRVSTRGQEFRTVDLSKVIGNVLENLHSAIEEKHGKVTVEGKLPTVRADDVQMAQLFQNLIANGLKFVKGREPDIRICAKERDGQKMITVQDNGIGIPAASLDRIFQIFQRLHIRDEYEGTGIGLAVCKKIVERHGGEIHVTSKVGEGSAFHVLLP